MKVAMNQNHKNLISGYERLLQQAVADREFIVSHAAEVSEEKYNSMLEKADADIDFANRKILELSIPSVSVFAPSVSPSLPVYALSVSAPILSEAPSSPVIPTKPNAEEDKAFAHSKLPETMDVKPEAIPDNSLWVLGVAVAGLVAVPFIIKWVAAEPPKNVQTIMDILKTVSKASGYVSR